MRLRSASHNSEEKKSPKLKEIKSQQFHKRIPLYEENGKLKERLHKMKFEVEDNLQAIIDNMDKDLQLKSKLINFQQIFQLIKEQINKDHEKIEFQLDQIERLQNNLESTVEQKQEEFISNQKWKKILSEQLQQNQQQWHEIKTKQEEQIKILTHQNYQSEVELDQVKKELLKELALTQEQKERLQRVLDSETKLNDQQSIYENLVNQLQSQVDQNNLELKKQLDLQKQKIEQKNQLMIHDNKYMIEEIQTMNKDYNLMKQQKETLEKNIENMNLKIKELKVEMILDKQKISKNEKQYHEYQRELIFQKNKIEIEVKREEKLQIQLEESEDDIRYLQQFQVNFLNLQKTLMTKQQVEIDKLQSIQTIELKNLENQIQIQKLKYEKLLGIKVDEKAIEQYQLIDFGQQYDEPLQGKKVQDLKNSITEQQKLIESLKNNINTINTANSAGKVLMNSNFQSEIAQFIMIHKQEQQKLQSDYEQLETKLQGEYNCKILLLSQQFSFSLDQGKQEQKQLQLIIHQFQLNGDEKSKLLETAAEEVMKLKKKYDHDINDERNIQKLSKREHEVVSLKIKEDYFRHQEQLKKEIENLQTQLKELQNIEHFLRLKLENMMIESKSDKSTMNSQEILIEKRQNEILKQNETIKGLNQRIKTLQLEVENAKQTFNIFAPADMINTQTDIKAKPDLIEQSKKLSLSRHNSQQGLKLTQIKQQMPQI